MNAPWIAEHHRLCKVHAGQTKHILERGALQPLSHHFENACGSHPSWDPGVCDIRPNEVLFEWRGAQGVHDVVLQPHAPTVRRRKKLVAEMQGNEYGPATHVWLTFHSTGGVLVGRKSADCDGGSTTEDARGVFWVQGPRLHVAIDQ